MAEVDNPPEREVKEFIFEQLCKFRVTPAQDVGKERIQHLASSSKYGLVFIAVSEGLKVVNTQDIVNLDHEHSRERSKIIVPNLPARALVPISHPISHVALSCDDLTLAVACTVNANIILYMYDVRAFSQPNAKPNPFKMVRVNGSPTLADISWNPEAANTTLACTADGHIELLEIDDNDIKIATLPTSTNACCVCWSPKGKQFVVGKNDGTLAQYDKTMLLRKNWPCPPILDADAGPYKVIDVLWLSTYMFLVAYLPQSEDPTDQPLVVLITSSKEGKTTYANFEDICFGSGEERKAKYYMNLILKWDMAVIGSANATETTIVAKNLDDKVTWEHWILEDSGRAELPLTESKCDSFPVGFSISYCSTASDGNAASPLLLLLSTDGLLVPFYMKYSHADAVAITTPPLQLTPDGERKGTPIPTQKATVSSTALTSTPPTIPPVANSFQFTNNPAVSSSTPPTTTTPQAFNLTSTPVTAAPFGQSKTQSTGFYFTNPDPKTTAASTGAPAKPLFGDGTSGFSFNAPNTSTTNIGTKPVASTSSSAFSLPPSSSSSGLFSFGTNQTPSFGLTGSGNVAAPKPSLSGGSVGSKPSGFPGITSTTSVPAFGSGTPTFSTSITKTDNTSGKPSISTGIGLFSGAPASTTSAGAGISKPTAAIGAMPSSTPSVTGLTKPSPTSGETLSTVHSQSSVDSLIHETSEMTFTESIFEEMAHFEKELQDLKLKNSSSKWEVGTKAEMQTIKDSTEKFSKFTKDFIDLTKGQNTEIADQKAQCLDAYDRAEDCNVRKERNTDPRYLKLLWSRALDPASTDALKKLQQQYQAIEQGIRDVDLILDKQWDSYQESKNKRGRIQIPTNDKIYSALKSHHKLILGQRNVVDEIQEKLKHLQLYRSPLNHSLTDTLNSLNSSNSSSKPSSRRSSLKCSPGGSVSPEKSAKLREMLMNRRVPRIKSTAPANLSMSKIIGSIQDTSRVDSSINNTTAKSLNKNISFGQSSNETGIGISGNTTKATSYPVPTSATGYAFFKRPHSGTEPVNVVQANPQVPGMFSGQQTVNLKLPTSSGARGSLAFGTSKLVSPSAGQTSISQLSSADLAAYVDKARQQGLPQQYEDVTPPSSSRTPNDEYDDYDDEDEDEEDDEEYDEEEDEDEAGFGPAYSYSFNEMKPTPTATPKINSGKQEIIGKNLFGTSSPFSGFAAGDQSKTPEKSGLAPFGLGTKMFGASGQTKPPTDTSKGQFTFTPTTSTFSFGASGSSTSSLSQMKPTAQSGFSLGSGLAGSSTPSTFSFTSGGSNLFSKAAVQDAAVSLSAFGKSPPSSQEDSSSAMGNPLNVKSHPTLMTLLSNDEPGGKSSGTNGAQPDIKQENSNTQPTSALSTSSFGQASSDSLSGNTKTASASNTPLNVFGANSTTIGTQGSIAPGGLFGSLSSAGSLTGNTGAASIFGGSSTTKGLFSSTTPGSIFGLSNPSEPTDTTKDTGKPETSTISSSVVSTSAETKTTAGFGFGTSGGFSGKPMATNLFGMGATTSSSSQPVTTSTSSASSGFFRDTQGETLSTKTTEIVSPGNKATTETLDATSDSKSKADSLKSPAVSTADTSTSLKTVEPTEAKLEGSHAPPPTTNAGTISTSVLPVQTVDAKSTIEPNSSEGKEASSQKVGEVKSSTPTTGLFGTSNIDPTNKVEEGKVVGLFGSSGSAVTTPTTTAAAASGGLFSSAGNASVPATTTGGLFTSTTTSAQSSIFGSAASFTGFSTAPSGNSSSVFGGPPSFGSGTAPSFGKATPTAGSVFGNDAANPSSTSGFGQTSSFGSLSSSNSVFGAKTEQTSSSVFGSGNTGFGSTSGTGQSTGFGQPSVFGQTSSSDFGQPTASPAPTFGQSPAQSSTSGGFGSGSGNAGGSGGLFSGLGGQPSAEKANTNVFGANQTFGTNSQQTSSLFGNSSSTSGFSASGGFGGGGGGGGSFSQSASAGVSATGFGAATTSPVSGGFGGAPAFGTNSGFGASPRFGGVPAFGSTPVFGSATSTGFGSSATFGSPSGPPTSFTGFNSAGSPSFGSIAQTSDQPSFGSVGQTSGGFGNQPSFGGQQPPSFGSPNQGGFGNSSSFSSYR